MLTLTSLLVAVSLMIVVLWGWIYWTYLPLIKVAKTLPGAFRIRFPILGHIPYTLFGTERTTKWAFERLTELFNNGVKTISCSIGPFPKILICDVADIQKILNSSSTSEKGVEIKYLNYFLGNGLLTAPGHIWKIKRRHINPLFTPNNMEHMMPTFNQNSEELVSNLSRHVGQGPFDVMDDVMDTSLKTVCHLIFGPGIVIAMNSKGFKGFKHSVDWFTEIFTARLIKPWLRKDAIFEFLYRKKIQETRTSLNDFIKTPLKIARKRKEQKITVLNSGTGAGSDIPQVSGTLNLLDVHSVLEEKFPEFTETDLRSEIVTLLVTGSDTIGGSVSTCLLLLGQHQDVQERLYTEIESVVGRRREVTPEDLRSLLYLDQVYKETLRLAILVPYIIRKTKEDIKLSACTLPAGYTLSVAIGAIHLDPRIYPNPLNFDPERFSPKNMGGREKYAFLPFSGGPRNCIGKHYSNMFIKVILVHVLRKYKITASVKNIHSMKKKFKITYVSAEGYNVTLEKR